LGQINVFDNGNGRLLLHFNKFKGWVQSGELVKSETRTESWYEYKSGKENEDEGI